jgi:hypothetical protein
MHEPSDTIFPAKDPGAPPIRERDGRPELSNESRWCARPKIRQLVELQQERQQMSRALRRLPDAIQRSGARVRRLFLDAWCRRVLEIELEMDRLREEILSASEYPEVGVPPLEVRLIQRLFTARWHHNRARRWGPARARPLCRAVVPRHRVPLRRIGRCLSHRSAPQQIVACFQDRCAVRRSRPAPLRSLSGFRGLPQ